MTSESNQKTSELNELRDQSRRLEETLMSRSTQFEDTRTKFDLARAEVHRNQAECQKLSQDIEAANHRNTFLTDT
jgi:peptidoglycan hydrolase CwlO-like protein